mgnify:CR=1 FL=1
MVKVLRAVLARFKRVVYAYVEGLASAVANSCSLTTAGTTYHKLKVLMVKVWLAVVAHFTRVVYAYVEVFTSSVANCCSLTTAGTTPTLWSTSHAPTTSIYIRITHTARTVRTLYTSEVSYNEH